MPRGERTVSDRVSDWMLAYNAVREELTPPILRQMSRVLIEAVPPEGTQDLDAIQTYLQQVNMAGGVTRVVMSNDRQAAIVAAMLTQSGVARPTVIDEGDGA